MRAPRRRGPGKMIAAIFGQVEGVHVVPAGRSVALLRAHPGVLPAGVLPAGVAVLPFVVNELTLAANPLKVREYLAAVKHRRRTLLIAFCVGLLVAILLAVLLPPRFRSSGTILIEQQEMPQELVRSTVTSYADERVPRLRRS